MSTTLVILTLNEIQGLRALFNKIPFNEVNEYFIVDGGSNDGTLDFASSKGIRIIPQKSKGRGEAFRIAILEARYDNIIFFSPDGNENPEDILKLIKLLEDGYDMAIASRFLKGARNEEDDKIFRFRAWANRYFTFIANLIWNKCKYITDTINGFRAIRKNIFEMMKIDAKGFLVEYQMSIRAMKLKLKVAEIPTIEGNRIGGKSSAKSIPTGLRFLKFLIKEIFTGKSFNSNSK